MKHIKLTQPARVEGELKYPHDGVLSVADDDEAQRLIDEDLAEDVSDDFKTKASGKSGAAKE